MSINSQIQRIKNNILSAYLEIDSKGGTIPSQKTSGNLASAISSISTEGSGKFISISNSEAIKNNDHRQDIDIALLKPSAELTDIVLPDEIPTVDTILQFSIPEFELVGIQENSETESTTISFIIPTLCCTEMEVS